MLIISSVAEQMLDIRRKLSSVEIVGFEERTLPCSQEPAAGSYPEPDLSFPHRSVLLLEDPF
jgi:hypothetical protein